MHWLTTGTGPAPALADTPGVRARLPRSLAAAGAVPCLDHRRRRRRRDRGRPAGRRPPRRRAGSAPASSAGCWSWPRPRTAAGSRWPRTTAGCWSPIAAAGEVREIGRSDRRRLRPGLVAGLGLARLVRPGRGEPAPDPPRPARRRRRGGAGGGHPAAFRGHQSGLHPRRTAPGLPVHPHASTRSTTTGSSTCPSSAAPGRTWCRSARTPSPFHPGVGRGGRRPRTPGAGTASRRRRRGRRSGARGAGAREAVDDDAPPHRCWWTRRRSTSGWCRCRSRPPAPAACARSAAGWSGWSAAGRPAR